MRVTWRTVGSIVTRVVAEARAASDPFENLKLFGVERTVIEKVDFDKDEEVVVASVRPRKGATRRCGLCQRRCARYDNGEGRRRWRAIDLGTIKAYLESDAPRVTCTTHGVVVASVPWARHDAGHTHGFDDQVAWLATVRSTPNSFSHGFANRMPFLLGA